MDIWWPFPTGYEYGDDLYVDLHAQGYPLDYIWDRYAEEAMHKLPPVTVLACIEVLLEMALESRTDPDREYQQLVPIFRSIRNGDAATANRLIEAATVENPNGPAASILGIAQIWLDEDRDWVLSSLELWGEENEIPSEIAMQYAYEQQENAPPVIRDFFGPVIVLPMWTFLNEWRNRCLRRIGFDRIEGATLN